MDTSAEKSGLASQELAQVDRAGHAAEGSVSVIQAMAALDNLDDYARMAGITPTGAFNVLKRFIEQHSTHGHVRVGDVRMQDGIRWVCQDPDIDRWVGCPMSEPVTKVFDPFVLSSPKVFAEGVLGIPPGTGSMKAKESISFNQVTLPESVPVRGLDGEVIGNAKIEVQDGVVLAKMEIDPNSAEAKAIIGEQFTTSVREFSSGV